MVVASIRSKNPGAMWGRTGKRPSAERFVPTNNPLALKWSSTQTEYLSDGLSQGNNIAYFPTYLQGICAQLDLWRTSKNYRNRRFADAIHTWSGGNNVPSYIAYVKARVPGITEDTVMNDAFWAGPMGLGFLKAQAGHEAGQVYPAGPDDWAAAQRIVMSNAKPPPVATKTKAATVAATVTTTAATAAHAGGASPWVFAIIFLVGIAATVGLAWFFHKKETEAALPVAAEHLGAS